MGVKPAGKENTLWRDSHSAAHVRRVETALCLPCQRSVMRAGSVPLVLSLVQCVLVDHTAQQAQEVVPHVQPGRIVQVQQEHRLIVLQGHTARRGGMAARRVSQDITAVKGVPAVQCVWLEKIAVAPLVILQVAQPGLTAGMAIQAVHHAQVATIVLQLDLVTAPFAQLEKTAPTRLWILRIVELEDIVLRVQQNVPTVQTGTITPSQLQKNVPSVQLARIALIQPQNQLYAQLGHSVQKEWQFVLLAQPVTTVLLTPLTVLSAQLAKIVPTQP